MELIDMEIMYLASAFSLLELIFASCVTQLVSVAYCSEGHGGMSVVP